VDEEDGAVAAGTDAARACCAITINNAAMVSFCILQV
jgi:hypothetical protein